MCCLSLYGLFIISGYVVEALFTTCVCRPLELQVYAKSLQFLSFALRACHAIVIVEDSTAHAASIMKCLQVIIPSVAHAAIYASARLRSIV